MILRKAEKRKKISYRKFRGKRKGLSTYPIEKKKTEKKDSNTARGDLGVGGGEVIRVEPHLREEIKGGGEGISFAIRL